MVKQVETSEDFGHLGVCLVGSGAIAQDHVAALEALSVGRFEWVISRRGDAASDFAESFGFSNSATSLSEALRDPAVDLVIITSPSELHAQQASECLEAGKDVIVEIPIGLSYESVDNLLRQGHEKGGRIFVCHTMRSFPALNHIRNLISEGSLHVSQVSSVFGIPRRRNQGWAGTRSWIDNLLWHHACHLVDATVWALDSSEVSQLNALAGRDHPEFGMCMDLGIGFCVDGHIPTLHSLSYNCESLIWEIRFFGEEQTVVFRNGTLFGDDDSVLIPFQSVRDLTLQNAAILEALRLDEPCVYDLEDVAGSYRLLQKIQELLGYDGD